jgi:hypothetical protein
MNINDMTDKIIKKLCEKYGIEGYTINFDGSIDVDRSVDLSGSNLTELPLTFRSVTGTFDCSDNRLTTLKGCPLEITGSFFCEKNRLDRLDYLPNKIGDGKGVFSDNIHNIGVMMNTEIRVSYNDDDTYKMLLRSIRINSVLNDK